MSYFRVTVEDLETGDSHSAEVAAGDYVMVAFAPCHLHHVQRHATGTVQLTLRDHRPEGAEARCGERSGGQRWLTP